MEYSDYGYSKPETQMASADESSYDVDVPQQRFLCDGTGDESSCDFGYLLTTSGSRYIRYHVFSVASGTSDSFGCNFL